MCNLGTPRFFQHVSCDATGSELCAYGEGETLTFNKFDGVAKHLEQVSHMLCSDTSCSISWDELIN